MSENLREERVSEVLDMLTEHERIGLWVWVKEDGTRLLVGSGAYGPATEEEAEEAYRDFRFNTDTVRPYRAELEELTRTEEGREILLEAYRRFREEES